MSLDIDLMTPSGECAFSVLPRLSYGTLGMLETWRFNGMPADESTAEIKTAIEDLYAAYWNDPTIDVLRFETIYRALHQMLLGALEHPGCRWSIG